MTYDLPDGTQGCVVVGSVAPRQQRGGEPGWIRLSPPGDKCNAHWRHDASGWEVEHCGHPTANWPYFATDPAYPLDATVTHNGRGFRTLKAAFAAIEAVLRGELVATNARCRLGTRRICTRWDAIP